MPTYRDLNSYFKQYGKEVTSETESFMFIFARKLFENQMQRIKKNNPDLNIYLFENESRILNASVIRVDILSYAIILRNSIYEHISEGYKKNIEYFEKTTEEFNSLENETIFSFYTVFIYSYLIGHELGHILYGHFIINDSIDAIEENASLIFDNNSDDEITKKYEKNLLKMYMELNADMYGTVLISDKIIDLYFKSLKDNLDMPLVAIIKIAISSIYCVQNLIMKTHPISKSDYPHPTVRLSLLIETITKQLSVVFDEQKIGFNIKKTIDAHFMEIMTFIEDNDSGNCDILKQHVMDDIQYDIEAAKKGYKEFFLEMEQHFFKLA